MVRDPQLDTEASHWRDSANSRTMRILLSPTAAFGFALILRVALLVLSHHYEDRVHKTFLSSGLEALMIAHSLATGYGLSFPFPHYPYVTGWLAPAYPWLLSWGGILFHFTGHALTIFAQTLNVIFSALTCYPIFFLARKLFDRRIAASAGWIWAVMPGAVLMPISWTWDQSIAAFLLATVLWSTYSIPEADSPLHWSGYGLLWGAAALTNPTVCVLMPFFGAWIWIQRRRHARSSMLLLARAGFFFVLSLLPWTLRNHFELGGFSFVKTNLGVELWLGNNPAVREVYTPGLHPMEDYAEYRSLVLLGEPRYSHLKEQQAINFIRSNPREFARLVRNRVVDTWTGKYDLADNRYLEPLHLVRIFGWYTLAFSVLAVAGLLLTVFANASEAIPLATCLVIFPIPYYITHSSLRYRHPIDPILTILVTVAIARVVKLSWTRVAPTAVTVRHSESEIHEPLLT